jgi:thymidylate kinase
MRWVFVEGVSGVGKTTLARNLCKRLTETGHTAKVYLEGDGDNPIDFPWTKYLPEHVTQAEYSLIYKKAWEEFARKDTNGGYIIFDGSLMHHPINDMMRNFDAPVEQICAHVNALAQTAAAHRPLVIYLSSGNVAARLAKACQARNQTPRTPQQAQFWEERKQRDTTVLAQLPIPCEVFDVSQENWGALFDEIVKRVKEGLHV